MSRRPAETLDQPSLFGDLPTQAPPRERQGRRRAARPSPGQAGDDEDAGAAAASDDLAEPGHQTESRRQAETPPEAPSPETWSRPALEALIALLDDPRLAVVAVAAIRELRFRLAAQPPDPDSGELPPDPHPALLRALRQAAELLAEDDPER